MSLLASFNPEHADAASACTSTDPSQWDIDSSEPIDPLRAPLSAPEIIEYVLDAPTPKDYTVRMLEALYREALGGVVGLTPDKSGARLERLLGIKSKTLLERLRKRDNALYKRTFKFFSQKEGSAQQGRNRMLSKLYGTWTARRYQRGIDDPGLPTLELIWLKDYFARRPAIAVSEGPPIPSDEALDEATHIPEYLGPFISEGISTSALVAQQLSSGPMNDVESRALVKARCLLQDVFLSDRMERSEQRRTARALMAFCWLIGPCDLTSHLIGYSPHLFPFFLDPDPDLDDARWAPLFTIDPEMRGRRELFRARLAADVGFFYPGHSFEESGSWMIRAGEGLQRTEGSLTVIRARESEQLLDMLLDVLDAGAAGTSYAHLEGFPWGATRQSVDQVRRGLERLDPGATEHQVWSETVLAEAMMSVGRFLESLEADEQALADKAAQAEQADTVRERGQLLTELADAMETTVQSHLASLQPVLDLDLPKLSDGQCPTDFPTPEPNPDPETDGPTPLEWEQLQAENDALRQALFAAEDEVRARRRCAQTGGAGASDPSLNEAIERYVSNDTPDHALQLLAAMYPDRVRLLPSATGNETLDLQGATVMSKVGSLIRDGYTPLREEGFGGQVREVVPGKISPRESDRVESSEKLRSHRRFKDGDQIREIFPHMTLSHTVRLYFEFDRTEDRIIVGYMGKHLPTGRHATV